MRLGPGICLASIRAILTDAIVALVAVAYPEEKHCEFGFPK